MFGEETSGAVVGTAAETPSAWSSIGSAITGAVTGLAKQFPTVATQVLTSKAAESAAAAQAKLAEAERKKLQAQSALTPVVQTLKQESKWAIPLLIGGVGLLGFALWMRSKKK